MKKAFTLIELLVVIAIIAILAAILFPVFAQAKLAAKKTQGLSQMKQIGTATYIYASDYDDGIPTWNECFAYFYQQGAGAFPAECSANGLFAPEFHWDSKLETYVKNGQPTQADHSGIWQSPLREYPDGRSLGMNQLAMWDPSVFGAGSCQPSSSRWSGCYFWLNLGQVDETAKKWYVTDTGRAGRHMPGYFLNDYGEAWVPSWGGYKAYSVGQPWRYGNEGANYVYMDTHARYEPGDKMLPNPNRADTLAWPSAKTQELMCKVAEVQASTKHMEDWLYDYTEGIWGACPNR